MGENRNSPENTARNILRADFGRAWDCSGCAVDISLPVYADSRKEA